MLQKNGTRALAQYVAAPHFCCNSIALAYSSYFTQFPCISNATASLLSHHQPSYLDMSSDAGARPSKPQPHVLTAAPTSSPAPTSAAALDAGMRGRLEEFGKRMRAEHALRSELAKVVPVERHHACGVGNWRL